MPTTKEALENAERQSDHRYRQSRLRHRTRINAWVDSSVHHSLKCLAHHYGVTQREMLQRVILPADRRATQGMSEADFEKYNHPL